MKNFISVFILLLMINLLVPFAYYQLYYLSSFGQLPSNSESSGMGKDPLPVPSPSSVIFSDPHNTPVPSANTFELYNLETQELEELDIISFLVGSAACEMPVSYEVQAIKAQMIACHSYYLHCKKNGMPSDDLNLSFDEKHMKKYASKERLREFWGMSFDDNYQKFLRCAKEVQNIVVMYQGEVALTPYYAVSCGKTQSSENEWGRAVPYLVQTDSPLDAVSDNYLKVRTFTVQEMYDRLMVNFSGFELNIEKPEEWFDDIIYNESGYVTAVQLDKAKISG
ncbi:MAG: SpoIID/LytB domain-containing protein, partial [Oscillospiraceae bacterium]